MRFLFILCTFTIVFNAVKCMINVVLLELLGLFNDMTKDVEMTEPDSYDYSKIDSIFYKYANCKFFQSFFAKNFQDRSKNSLKS